MMASFAWCCQEIQHTPGSRRLLFSVEATEEAVPENWWMRWFIACADYLKENVI